MIERQISDEELLMQMRRQTDIWLNNANRLLVDELLRRFEKYKAGAMRDRGAS